MIDREILNYLKCLACGVVFADRDDPQNCPICAVPRVTDQTNFVSYDPKADSGGNRADSSD